MPSAKPRFVELWRRPSALLAFGLGSGLAPLTPGTWGTLAALPFWWLLAALPGWLYVTVVVVALLIGVAICQRTAHWLGVHDHGGIVWDEFVGLWITLFAVPGQWYWVLLGFVLFRFFDMAKPWPISWVDKNLGGGWGIMLDDVVAGLAAALCLQVAIHVIVGA